MSFVAIVLIGGMVYVGIYSGTQEDRGTSKSVLVTKKSVENYLQKSYSSYSGVTITAGKEVKLNSQNYSQNDLNDFYSQRGDGYGEITGTCWAVATTSVLKYNNAKPLYKNVFASTVQESIKKGWALPVEDVNARMGFTFDVQDNLLTHMFSYYDINKKGNNDYFDIYETLVSEVKNNRVVVFSIVGHTMVGCGYVPYTVKYSKTNLFGTKKTYSVKENFVIVNDGWENTNKRQYSYFPEREIGTGVISRWDFGITKIRNK